MRKQADGLIDRTVADQALALWQSIMLAWIISIRNWSARWSNCIKGGPVGLSTIAVNIGEETETVEDMYEPFLIQKDFETHLAGRIATLAYDHFGYPQRSE